MINSNDDIFVKIAVFEELFDDVRIVDPLRKKVLDIRGTRQLQALVWSKFSCFYNWNQTKICDNCVSMRSLVSKKEEMKFEFDGKSGYILTAKSFKLDENEYVIEFIKKLDKVTLLKEFDTSNSSEIGDLIKKFNEEIMKDSLTKIYNKRFVMERLPHELAYAILENQSISFAMGDIDFFKNVNDQYGHVCGDLVLETCARLLKANLDRADEWVARFGGEEFIIFFKGRTEEECYDILELARKDVENYCFKWEDREFGITISFGSVYLKNVDTYNGEGPDKYIEIADKNLYRAKETGRNRVVLTSI